MRSAVLYFGLAFLTLAGGEWFISRCGGQEPLTLTASVERVGQYERIEFFLSLETPCRNPYDPQEIDVSVRIEDPRGQVLRLPGFFLQEYEQRILPEGDGVLWLYPRGRGAWRARFAPRHVGRYRVRAECTDAGGTRRSPEISFDCVASDRSGFVRVGKKDPRFLEFDNGESFRPIGQNLAFIGTGQYVDPVKAEIIFAKLADNGANFLRIWTGCADWALAIEARKSAWDRSWSRAADLLAPLPEPNTAATAATTATTATTATITTVATAATTAAATTTMTATTVNPATLPTKAVRLQGDQYASIEVRPTHRVALRPGTRYVLQGAFRLEGAQGLEIRRAGQTWRFEGPSKPGGWQSFGREFQTSDEEYWLGRLELRRIGDGTLWIKDLSLTETGGGVELLWEADVNRPPRGFYNQVDCCWLDRIVEAAEQKGIYLMLCLFTRDLYMSSLADDTRTQYDRAIRDAKHLLRYAAARWGYSTHVAAWEYFNEIDPGLPTDRFYREMAQYLDEVDVHGHLRTTSTWHPSARDLQLECLDIGQLHHYMRLPDEDDVRDEVAVILDKIRFLRQHAPAKPVLIGEFGLATSKWALSNYMKQDTEGVHLHNCLWASAFAGSAGTALFWWWELLDRQDAYRHYRPLAKCLRQVSFAGLQTSTATARPESIRVLGYQGPRQAYLWLADQRAGWWNRVVEKRPPEEIRRAELKLDGLLPGTYSVQWRDTWDGNLRREETVTVTSNGLTLAVPPFRADIACLLRPHY